MAIYPDKKDGRLTGRFRVELQKGGRRYRKRWDSYKDAEADEKAVVAAWERGEDVSSSSAVQGAPEVHSFETVIPKAKGHLWDGLSSEKDCWAHIAAVARILGKHTRLDDVGTLEVDRVITKLKAKGLADGTINRYISHLRSFLVWAKGRGYRTAAIKDVIDFGWRKEAVGRIRWITEAEEDQLREYLPDNVWKLVKIAIETGCRRDELLTVEPDQINGNRLHLWKTKTDTPRTIPMAPETTAMLTELVASGDMPTRRNLRSWWDRAKRRMGLEHDDEFVFHVTRHTRATRMVDAGINIFVIKEWMGHKRIETTMRYAHVKPQNLEEALHRMGDMGGANGQKPRETAAFAVPHALPTGGALGHFTGVV